MAHPIYKVDGKRVPSVTTVLSRFKDAGGLIHWAWSLGAEGKDYRQERDKAATVGTACHSLVEADIRGTEPDTAQFPDEVMEKAHQAFANYERWRDQTHLKPIEAEVSLVSERYRYGGTFDAVLIDGELSLADWKTSNRPYPEHLIQLAAYGNLWHEHNPDKPLTGGYHLLLFSKDHGDWSHKHFAELDEPWEAFKLMRELYELDKSIKKRAA